MQVIKTHACKITQYMSGYNAHAPLPHALNTVQFIKFTYCHDKFPTTVVKEKIDIYNRLIQTLRTKGRKFNPLITIMADVRGIIHEP